MATAVFRLFDNVVETWLSRRKRINEKIIKIICISCVACAYDAQRVCTFRTHIITINYRFNFNFITDRSMCAFFNQSKSRTRVVIQPIKLQNNP
jgi:hypothetical protein